MDSRLPTEILLHILDIAPVTSELQLLIALRWIETSFWKKLFSIGPHDLCIILSAASRKMTENDAHLYMNLIRNWCLRHGYNLAAKAVQYDMPRLLLAICFIFSGTQTLPSAYGKDYLKIDAASARQHANFWWLTKKFVAPIEDDLMCAILGGNEDLTRVLLRSKPSLTVAHVARALERFDLPLVHLLHASYAHLFPHEEALNGAAKGARLGVLQWLHLTYDCMAIAPCMFERSLPTCTLEVVRWFYDTGYPLQRDIDRLPLNQAAKEFLLNHGIGNWEHEHQLRLASELYSVLSQVPFDANAAQHFCHRHHIQLDGQVFLRRGFLSLPALQWINAHSNVAPDKMILSNVGHICKYNPTYFAWLLEARDDPIDKSTMLHMAECGTLQGYMMLHEKAPGVELSMMEILAYVRSLDMIFLIMRIQPELQKQRHLRSMYRTIESVGRRDGLLMYLEKLIRGQDRYVTIRHDASIRKAEELIARCT